MPAEWEYALGCADFPEFAYFVSSTGATMMGDFICDTGIFGTLTGTGVGGGALVSANSAVASLLRASSVLNGGISGI